jgi:hypothetical protein
MRGGYVVAAATIVVGLVAAVALIVLATGSGIERAGATDCPEGSITSRLGDADGGRACTIVNTDTVDATFGVTIRNPGRLPITVTALPLAPMDLVGFTPEKIVEGAPPFRLGHDEEQQVLVQGRLPDCETRSTGGATTFRRLAFLVRTLGITRTQRVELEPAVRLVSEPC